MTKVAKINFKSGPTTKALLGALSDRARDVVERRFGLLGGEKMTLEAIGQIYDITRERVRQIESLAITVIRKSDQYIKAKPVFDELEDCLVKHGGLAKEENFLTELGKDEIARNQIAFLLAIGETFVRLREDDDYHHRWTLDEEVSDKVHSALEGLHKTLSYEDLIAETEILSRFSKHLNDELKQYSTDDQMRKWLSISKHVGANPLGEWGLASSPNVRTRGIRDYAYLVLRDKGEPMHFTDVAGQIEEMFDKSAHVATCHNELIKDERFVLVGRGLYALSEWGYANGVVRDVIKGIIEKKGPLSKSDLISEVMKQRQVKENTIYVNLQNPKYFKKDTKGRYQLA